MLSHDAMLQIENAELKRLLAESYAGAAAMRADFLAAARKCRDTLEHAAVVAVTDCPNPAQEYAIMTQAKEALATIKPFLQTIDG